MLAHRLHMLANVKIKKGAKKMAKKRECMIRQNLTYKQMCRLSSTYDNLQDYAQMYCYGKRISVNGKCSGKFGFIIFGKKSTHRIDVDLDNKKLESFKFDGIY